MLRKLILVCFILLSGCASNPVPVCLILFSGCNFEPGNRFIRTVGVGNTYEEAKHNSFREAIQYTIGVAISSERETHNNQLLRDDILAYSSAYVDEYKIISQEQTNGKVRLVVDVKLSSLRLSDRILSKGKDSKQFDGDKHQTQHKSFTENKQNGDRLVDSILNDYPYHAYDIKQGKYVIQMDNRRNLSITIPYELSWNKNYLNSLSDALKLVEDNDGSWFSKPPHRVRVKATIFYFNDVIVLHKIINALGGDDEVRIKLELRGEPNLRNVHVECFTPDSVNRRVLPLYHIDWYTKKTAGLNGSLIENGQLTVRLPNSMNNLSEVRLSIVSKRVCPR
jgi:hypothetical protein